MMYTDIRAKFIAEAEAALQVLQGQIATTPVDQLPSLLTSILEASVQRDAALRMQQHVYECAHCRNEDGQPERFSSAARFVKVVSGFIEHDEEGNVLREVKFTQPHYEILCPGCSSELRPAEYLTNRW